jgi:hypothetical protein
MPYKIHHKEIKRSCVSHTFIEIDEAIETAKRINNLEQLTKYESLKKQGEKSIDICNGPEAPDYCDPKDIVSCKGCKNYRNIEKYG